jgi:hypothetical protein
MDANLSTHLSFAALALAAASLFISLVAAFPGLKGLLAAIRDGVLWFALFLVMGAVGFVVWQHLENQPGPEPPTSAQRAP